MTILTKPNDGKKSEELAGLSNMERGQPEQSVNFKILFCFLLLLCLFNNSHIQTLSFYLHKRRKRSNRSKHIEQFVTLLYDVFIRRLYLPMQRGKHIKKLNK